MPGVIDWDMGLIYSNIHADWLRLFENGLKSQESKTISRMVDSNELFTFLLT